MSITLLNETCHVILQNRSERFEFFKLLRRDNENNFVIFDCEFNNDFGNSEIILVESYKHLLECLQEFLIPDKKSSFFDINGLIVVIDNISLFYWQLKHEKFTNFYSKFLDLLDEIKLKYKCNIVITSWGSNYEKGFNYKQFNELNNEELSKISFLPNSYLDGIDCIVDYNRKIYRN